MIMDNKFQRPNKAALTNAQYFSFMTAFQEQLQTASTTATIVDNIKNPTTHYYNSGNYGPCNTTYYNMWDAQQTSTGDNISTATVKTVYDPCPPGFCVPTGNLYKYANGQSGSTTWDGTNKGRTRQCWFQRLLLVGLARQQQKRSRSALLFGQLELVQRQSRLRLLRPAGCRRID